MSVPSLTLATRAEAAIRRLRGVEGVSVRVVGDEIREIHVLASADRPPKNVVRDVQTALRAGIGTTIDHRVVSVAQAEYVAKPLPATSERPAPPTPKFLPDPEPEPEANLPAPMVREERVRFESVNLFVSGPRTQAQVELRWKGLPRMGSASGWSTRDESHRLVAQATAAAMQEFLAEPVAFNIHGVDFLDMGRKRVVVVAVSLMVDRRDKALTGSCAIEQDTPQAVVLATLAALNRVVSGMRVKEPTEYVLRPESYTT